MAKQIFISHSAKDAKAIKRFLSYFEDTDVKPVLMEYEKWSRNNKPNWLWIKEQIQQSEAVFVILTRNVTNRKPTQNWVAFEIGVAATCAPPKPVVVFRAQERISFPVPYLNHYFRYDITRLREYSRRYLNKKPASFESVIVGLLIPMISIFSDMLVTEIIKNPTRVFEDKQVNCINCKMTFHYWGADESEFRCPCCNTKIIHNLAKI